MSRRRKARQYALQLLFRLDITRENINWADFNEFWEDIQATEDVISFAKELVKGTWDNLERIDNEIRNSSSHWTLERINNVDRSLLRLAAFELLYRNDIPASVSINEALEIAKKFSSMESISFINGILDNIAKKAV